MEPILRVPGDRAPPALTEHLLEEILVRIGAPADLIRASAACKSFRLLITDPTFLRRYRSLHPPLLLGFVNSGFADWFLPVDAPHPNAPAARAFAGAADFSFNHLGDRGVDDWFHCDARDGRFLLMVSSSYPRPIPPLAVCDPLTLGYTPLPAVPDCLLASVLGEVEDEDTDFFYAFFEPSGGYEEEHFRVICWTCCSAKGVVFVYSSVSDSWTHGISMASDALGLDIELLQQDDATCQWPNYANGCLYWKQVTGNKLIKLNIDSMKFSTVSLPPDYGKRDTVVVEAGEERIGMFSLIHGPANPRAMCYYIRLNESENANEQPVETSIPLSQEYDEYHFGGSAQGYVFLIGIRKIPRQGAVFSLEIKTMKLERVCSADDFPYHVLPYFGFPPFMSTRRI